MLSVIQAANMGQQSAAMGQEIRNAIERASIQREAHMRQQWRDERNAAVEDAGIQMRMLGAGRGVTGGQVQETADYSRPADPSRTVSFQTAGGRNIETEIYTPEDISRRASVAEVARQKMLGEAELEQKQAALGLTVDIPGMGALPAAVAGPLIGLRREAEESAAAVARQKAQQEYAEAQAAKRQEFEKGEHALDRTSRERAASIRDANVGAMAARREELAAAKAAKKATPETLAALVLQQSAAGGGQTIDDAIQNAGTFYQNDPRFTPEMRASVMVELAKMKQSGKPSNNPLRVKKKLEAAPAAPAAPAPASPQLLTSVATGKIPEGAPTATNSKGEKIYFDGAKWVPAR
jgi:hypothetical protein